MIINHNLQAMNTHRQLGIANNGGAKSMEKLSSGYRINRAGDDAAGLAISEKMRGQIRGLNQASRNAQDGISLIQTAEGALDETHAILQRMRELAVQSSTDTNTDADRTNIQDEIDQLASEITRISETTEFNTMKLIDGSFEGKKFHIGANENQDITFDVNDMGSKALGLEEKATIHAGKLSGTADSNLTVSVKDGSSANVNFTLSGASSTTAIDVTKDANGVTSVKVGSAVSFQELKDRLAEEGIELTITDDTKAVNMAGLSGTSAKIGKFNEADVKIGAAEINVTNDKIKEISIVQDNTVAVSGSAAIDEDGVLTITVSGIADVNDAAKMNEFLKGKGIEGVTFGTGAVTLGTVTDIELKSANKGTATSGATTAINVSTQDNASKAITTINNALETVSKERSKLGSIQNRLEHTIKNLDTSAENLQASEARIRDVDMAKEMMEQTKQNILQQASTAMLAQANQHPQGVLQLLR